MARDSGLTPEGETVTTKFTKKLHTVHMLYRSPDSLWSTKDKLEAVVLVVAPDTEMGEVVKFVSQMEMLFPGHQKQFTRSTLDATEVKRLQASVQGRNLPSAMSVKMPTATRTGSQSGSTTSTKTENDKSSAEEGSRQDQGQEMPLPPLPLLFRQGG